MILLAAAFLHVKIKSGLAAAARGRVEGGGRIYYYSVVVFSPFSFSAHTNCEKEYCAFSISYASKKIPHSTLPENL
jgi:hypothetical protein